MNSETSIDSQNKVEDNQKETEHHHHHHKRSSTFIRDSEKVGRNDLCPCGSKMKYKKCCLKKQMERNLIFEQTKEAISKLGE